jgi:1,4-alpha-glucan branching enzyme
VSGLLHEAHRPDPGAVDAILHARHGDPFALLGPHNCEGGCAVRTFQPGAIKVEVLGKDSEQVLATLSLIDPAGFWSGVMPARIPYRLRITHRDRVQIIEDAYAFGPSLGEVDIYLLAPVPRINTKSWVLMAMSCRSRPIPWRDAPRCPRPLLPL